MVYDPKTAKISRRRFGGSNYHVWSDAHGNMQLCCYSAHAKGWILVGKATIDAFVALACAGTKSVRFANPVSRTDVVVEIDELSILEPIDSAFGKPYYLIGAETFVGGDEAYPGSCSVI